MVPNPRRAAGSPVVSDGRRRFRWSTFPRGHHPEEHLTSIVPQLWPAEVISTPGLSRARLFARRLHALVRRGICQRARLRQRPTEGLPHDVLACEIIPCLVSGLTS